MIGLLAVVEGPKYFNFTVLYIIIKGLFGILQIPTLFIPNYTFMIQLL
jgi:hypothetical protein